MKGEMEKRQKEEENETRDVGKGPSPVFSLSLPLSVFAFLNYPLDSFKVLFSSQHTSIQSLRHKETRLEWKEKEGKEREIGNVQRRQTHKTRLPGKSPVGSISRFERTEFRDTRLRILTYAGKKTLIPFSCSRFGFKPFPGCSVKVYIYH